MYILYTICYCTSLGFPRVYVVFTIPYTRLGLYIFFYLYMIIQNTEYTVYSLSLCVSLSKLNNHDGNKHYDRYKEIRAVHAVDYTNLPQRYHSSKWHIHIIDILISRG
jgi:hypothetical protein